MIKSYKDVIISGATFPDDPYRLIPVHLNSTMTGEYLPALKLALPDAPKGLQLLVTAMAYMEGFYHGSRSYRNNNPGNIGSMDNGVSVHLPDLATGIQKQESFIKGIVAGKSHHYPLNQQIEISTLHSIEIANNPGKYGNISPDPPTYHFIFTGQIDQFTKIYSTGARSTNVYINTIVSYFNQNGLTITPESKLQDIILMTNI